MRKGLFLFQDAREEGPTRRTLFRRIFFGEIREDSLESAQGEEDPCCSERDDESKKRKSDPDDHPYCSNEPDGSCCGDSGDLFLCLENDAGSQETDAAHDLSSDSHGIGRRDPAYKDRPGDQRGKGE